MREHIDKDWRDVDKLSDLPRKPFAWFKPPWHRYGHDYDGRVEWWADYRYKDPVLRSGRWRAANWPVSEHTDPYYADPPVEDGTSQIGFDGRDQTYEAGDYRARQTCEKTGREEKWLEYVLTHSTQYKDIAKKWNISPEHPGLRISPQLGTFGWGEGVYKREAAVHNKWLPFLRSYNPRFFDEPLDKGTFTKGLFGLKVGLLLTINSAIFANLYWDFNNFIKISSVAKRFAQFAPWLIPAPVAMCTTVSLAAQYRQIDDMWNWVIASFSASFITATTRRRPHIFFTLGLPLTFVSCWWHVAKTSEFGSTALRTPVQLSSYLSGPVAHLNPKLPHDDR